MKYVRYHLIGRKVYDLFILMKLICISCLYVYSSIYNG